MPRSRRRSLFARRCDHPATALRIQPRRAQCGFDAGLRRRRLPTACRERLEPADPRSTCVQDAAIAAKIPVDRRHAAWLASSQQSLVLRPVISLLNSTFLPSMELEVVITPCSVVAEKFTSPVVVNSSNPEHCIVKWNSDPT